MAALCQSRTKIAKLTFKQKQFKPHYLLCGTGLRGLRRNGSNSPLHSTPSLPWVPEAFHARFPVSTVVWKTTKLVLVVFSPLVSSAEQREKNLWYPGYAFPSLGYIVYTSVTWPIVKNAWRHCALSLDVKNPFFPRPFCYDRRVHMTALCAYHCDNIMAHGHLTKRKYQFTSRGNILQSPSQCMGVSRSPKEHYLDDWEISPNLD